MDIVRFTALARSVPALRVRAPRVTSPGALFCISRVSLRLLFLADLCKAENSAVTRMTAENLAVVFAPCLMASNGTQMSLELVQMENRKRVVTSLILAVQSAVGWA